MHNQERGAVAGDVSRRIRGGDAVSGWAYAGLSAIGLGLPAIALAAVPLAGVWMATGLRLGRAQDSMAARTET